MEQELFIAGRFFHVGRINVAQFVWLGTGNRILLAPLSIMRAVATLLGNSTQVEMGRLNVTFWITCPGRSMDWAARFFIASLVFSASTEEALDG